MGETQSRSASLVYGRSTKVYQAVVEAEDGRLVQAGARVMTASELRVSELRISESQWENDDA